MIISQDLAKGYVKDAYGYAMESYDQIEEVWPLIYKDNPIDKDLDFWQRTSVVDDGAWRKTAEAEGFQATGVIEGYTVYAAIFTYTKAKNFSEKVARNIPKMKNLIKEFSTKLGETAKKTREEFFAFPFNYGGLTAGHWSFNGTPESKAVTDSSGDLGYDNSPFFNLSTNTRSSKGGGTYYNGFSLDLDTINGFENIKTIRNHMQTVNNREENDTRIALKVDTILTPAGSLADRVAEILNSTLVPYGTTNTTNILKGRLNPIEWQYLTDTDAWFLGCAKQGLDCLRATEPRIRLIEDEIKRCVWLAGEMEVGYMMWNWRFWAGSNFSTS